MAKDDEPIIYIDGEPDRMLIINAVIVDGELVGGTRLKSPAEFQWGWQQVSDQNAGRTQDTTMHVNRIGIKRKLELEWQNLTPQETYEILQVFQPEYIRVTYHDPLDSPDPDAMSTRTFYTGDKSAPIYSWYIGGERYEKLTFNLIER